MLFSGARSVNECAPAERTVHAHWVLGVGKTGAQSVRLLSPAEIEHSAQSASLQFSTPDEKRARKRLSRQRFWILAPCFHWSRERTPILAESCAQALCFSRTQLYFCRDKWTIYKVSNPTMHEIQCFVRHNKGGRQQTQLVHKSDLSSSR